MSRPSFHLDGNGKPIRRSPLILPGERPQVIPHAAAPPRMDLVVGHNGEVIFLALRIGEQAIPMPMTEDQVLHHIAVMLGALQQLRASRCPSESPATGPDDCPGPADTGTMTDTPGTETPPGSTAAPDGGRCDSPS